MPTSVTIDLDQKISQCHQAFTQGFTGEACGMAEDLLSRVPDNHMARAPVLLLGALACGMQNRFEEAIARGNEALAKAPANPSWHLPISGWCLMINRHEDALRHARQAEPRQPAANAPEFATYLRELSKAHQAVARVLVEMDGAEALALTHTLSAIGAAPENPDAHLLLAEQLLRARDWRAGWAEYEWINKMDMATELPPMVRRHAAWNGMKMPKGSRLVVIADQGYGDTIQFSRYLHEAKTRFDEVFVGVSLETHHYFKRVLPVTGMFSLFSEIPAHAVHCRISSLPWILGATGTPPPPLGLRADELKSRLMSSRVLRDRKGPLVGLVWSGRETHPNNLRRSTRLSTFLPLASTGASFVSLQKPMPDADRMAMAEFPGLTDISSELNDFDDTVGLIAGLDLVICIDTGVGHLAASMGKPVWMVVPKHTDWRWPGNERDPEVWYPGNVTLYRQKAHGDWSDPINRMAADLAELASQSPPEEIRKWA